MKLHSAHINTALPELQKITDNGRPVCKKDYFLNEHIPMITLVQHTRAIKASKIRARNLLESIICSRSVRIQCSFLKKFQSEICS
jgi:hypothetical protein